MKILLLTDVKNVGRRGEVKEIPDGYAQNFIIPRKLGEPATKEKIQKLENSKNKIESDKQLRTELLLRELSRVQEKEVTIARKVNASGSLFGALTEREVYDAVKATLDVHIPMEYLFVPPIKHTGTYDVIVGDKKKLGKSFVFTLKVTGQ
jgi:large subunit ribosomal protein L9